MRQSVKADLGGQAFYPVFTRYIHLHLILYDIYEQMIPESWKSTSSLTTAMPDESRITTNTIELVIPQPEEEEKTSNDDLASATKTISSPAVQTCVFIVSVLSSCSVQAENTEERKISKKVATLYCIIQYSSTVCTVYRNHKGQEFLAPKYHPKTSFTFTFVMSRQYWLGKAKLKNVFSTTINPSTKKILEFYAN